MILQCNVAVKKANTFGTWHYWDITEDTPYNSQERFKMKQKGSENDK